MTEARVPARKGNLLRHSRDLRWLGVAAVVFLVAACGGGNEEPTPSSPAATTRVRALNAGAVTADMSSAVKIQGLVKKSETRLSRTVFEYEYALVLANSGPELQNVEVRLTGSGANTTLVDGVSLVAQLPAKGTLTTTDTIRVRHDRLLAFRPDQLVWQVTGATLGPVALPGSPTDQAVDQMPEYRGVVTFPSSEIDIDPVNTVTVIRTKWILGFRPGTTVAQINSLLRSLGATIVRSYAQTAVLEVRVPDPGSLVAMNAALAALKGNNPYIDIAMPVLVTPTNALPPAMQGQADSDLKYLSHQLAVRAANAWNARAAKPFSLASSALTLLVIDSFGNDMPEQGLLAGAATTAIGTGFFASGTPRTHGYHVLGIAAASFKGSADPKWSLGATSVAGIFALDQPLSVEVVDLTSSSCPGSLALPCWGTTLPDQLRDVVLRASLLNRRLVVNTSLGFNTTGGVPAVTAEFLKLYWLRILRGGHGTERSPVEDQYFHATSAGNNALLPANQNTGWARAALDGSLDNTAVVENRSAASSAPFRAGDLHASSSRGGNISAIGSTTSALLADQGVWSYGDAKGKPIYKEPCSSPPPLDCPMAGTSMAAPQVAGLAASLWALRPSFTAKEVLQTIQSNVSTNVVLGAGQPLIDAYATLLAADEPVALSGMGDPSKAPVRLAILDINDVDGFTHEDAIAFIDAFAEIKGGSAFGPATRTVHGKTFDLTRFDLNGDGYVGGTGNAKFNLDISYESSRRGATFGVAPFKVGLQRTVNENAVTDLDVLCYYVYSPLFRGDRSMVASHLTGRNLSCASPVTLHLPGLATAEYFTQNSFRPSVSNVSDPTTKMCAYSAIDVAPPHSRHEFDRRRCDIQPWPTSMPRGTFRIAVQVINPVTSEILAEAESEPVTISYGVGVIGGQSLVCGGGRFSAEMLGGGPKGTVLYGINAGNGTLEFDSCGRWGKVAGQVACERRDNDPPDTTIQISGNTSTYVYHDGVGTFYSRTNGFLSSSNFYFGFGGVCLP